MSRIIATRVCFTAILLGFVFLTHTSANAQAESKSTRVGTQCFTSWDEYYFYAAFVVNDSHVNSTNTTPLSQPQQDDDIEIFFDTNGPKASEARLPGTFQMAVSAGNGAYFSTGSDSGHPKAKAVFTYKFAATVDGTLNNNNDTDLGYTIEVAIPWQELGRSGPPAPGSTWGFNIINRDRSSLKLVADHMGSLSPLVAEGADVQNPKDWTSITFGTGTTPQHSGIGGVYCPHVVEHYPLIDGVLRSGEWYRPDGFEIGEPTISAPAPTIADEPNVTTDESVESAKALISAPTPATATPVPTPIPAPKPTPATATPLSGYEVGLPGGGTLHIGKLAPPPPVIPTPVLPSPDFSKKHGKHSNDNSDDSIPRNYKPLIPTVGPKITSTQDVRLLDQTNVGSLILALYSCDFKQQDQPNSDFPAGVFVDQPVNGAGSWFGGGSLEYQLEEASSARRCGIDVLLVKYEPTAECNSDLMTLVQALRELKAQHRDYPLLAPYIFSDSDGQNRAIDSFFARVPVELRAQALLPDADINKMATIVAVHTAGALNADSIRNSVSDEADLTGPLMLLRPSNDTPETLVSAVDGVSVNVGLVSPVSDLAKQISSRNGGDAYNKSWNFAESSNTDWVLLNSWNDYAAGTEATATRQYGEHYVDLTSLNSEAWNGGQQWHVRYLQAEIPHEISPDTITTVQVRLENAGTLPWRFGEAYSLSYRWYKDGRLYDDSGPRVSIADDVYPGQSTTVRVGIVARDQYGSPLEPGEYTLVFDLVQGNDRWFGLAGDIGLKTYVSVLKPGDSVKGGATFIGSTLPTRIASGTPYQVEVSVRNDSAVTWKAGTTELQFDASADSDSAQHPVLGTTTLKNDVAPGSIATVPVHFALPTGSPALYKVKWSIQNPEVTGHLWQSVQTTQSDLGESFVISDIPRIVKAAQTYPGTIGVADAGPNDWRPGTVSLGYHWAYADGFPVKGTAEIFTPIQKLLASNQATAIPVKFTAPSTPGRYFLVWDVRGPENTWGSTLGQKMHANSTYPLMVTVVEGAKTQAQTIDITKLFNTNPVASEGQSGGVMDANGDAYPASQLPPDGTEDTVSNPLLIGVPGPAYYPSGFYSSTIGHETAFRFGPSKNGSSAIACDGQKIGLPSGYSTLHLLAASSASAKAEAFMLDNTIQTVTINSWSDISATDNLGLKFPYHLKNGVVDGSAPSVLYDVAIPISGARSVTLPKDVDIKIFAVTVTK